MKNFLCLLFCFPVSLQAQDWPVETAVWEYCVNLLPAGQIGTQSYAYTDDVLINDTSYSVIRPTAIDGEPYSNEQAELNNQITLIRQSGDTIYRRISNKEYIFFVNGLEIGDTFITFRSAAVATNLIACLEDLVLEVIDVEMVEYGGIEYRSVLLQDQNVEEVYGFEPIDPLQYTFVEGIGLLTNFPYYWDVGFPDEPFPPSETCAPSSDGIGNINLYEYSDSMTGIDIGTCQPSGLAEEITGKLEIYPNPSSNYITIHHVGILPNSKYAIYNGQGILVDQSTLSSHTVDVSKLPSGVYSIIVDVSSNSKYSGRILIP